MPIPNSEVIRFSPLGLCDSLDETNTAPGGMTTLQNLIPDPTTKNLWGCRPAAEAITSTSTSSFVVEKPVGDFLYGMRTSITYPGFDEPFCLNLLTNAFLTLSNVTGSNIPVTQPTTGDWTPPTINVVGVNVIVTHPGFDGMTNFFGWFDTTDPTAIVWNAGNLSAPGGIESLGPIAGGSGYVNGTYTSVPFTSASVRTFGTLTAGSGYVDGTYFNVPLTGGTGTGALATIQVTGGAVVTCLLTRGGLGYTASDTLSASNTNLGGSGSGFAIVVSSISPGTGATGIVIVAGGVVTRVILLHRGTGFATTDDVTASNTFLGGSGSGFKAAVALIFFGRIVFTTPPSWVVQFSQRAYFGVNPVIGQPSVIFTDILFLNCSNADQALTFGDNIPLIAGHGLPLDNQLGGIVQALLIFKGTEKVALNIQQVTGDYALGNLSINALNIATGTLSPWSICDTPKGVAFLAPDGYRLIDFRAQVSDPIGTGGMGVVVPFLNNISPTRVAAACNSNVLRVNVQPSNILNTPYLEYWFDISRGIWSGPHTFPSSVIVPYGNTFILVPRAVPTRLFSSQVIPNPTSSSVENGVATQFAFQTVVLADPVQLAEMSLSDLTVNMALVVEQGAVNIAVVDENNSVLNSVVYQITGTPSLWGSMVWGTSVWRGGTGNALRPRYAAFNAPVVYRRIAVYVSGPCAQGFQIGDILLRRQILGYPQAVL